MGDAAMWLAEKMLDGQRQRVDIPVHVKTTDKGLLQKRLKRISAESSVMSPQGPNRSSDWTESSWNELPTRGDVCLNDESDFYLWKWWIAFHSEMTLALDKTRQLTLSISSMRHLYVCHRFSGEKSRTKRKVKYEGAEYISIHHPSKTKSFFIKKRISLRSSHSIWTRCHC